MSHAQSRLTPRERYQHELAHPGIEADPAQARAVEALQTVFEQLIDRGPIRPRGLLARLVPGRRRSPVRGLYLWGGVGRGKTWLMDGFFESLPFPDKRRFHFHRFMHRVHDELARLRQQRDPLEIVAEHIAAETRVLCFDEFFVADITDAMLLGNLFTALFRRGVTLVATSNVPPDDLYRDGLQRQRFLPAIAEIKRHTRVMHMDNGVDYRFRVLEKAEIFHWPSDAEADALLAESFRGIAGNTGRQDIELEIEHRVIHARREADGVVWLDFAAACQGPRGQADYIELARCYHTVLLSGVPRLTADLDNEARRFIALVDEFYDRRVKLIIAAQAPLERLYDGRRLSFEFRRTVSRLQEMQTLDYLASEHRP
ncbi:MAG: cell division protein ZapE [Gammaproteobacteria bacterium]|jgi:cell division protein ZapE